MRNALYYGDNLDILRNKIAPGSVDLCYIDPPFNSKRNYFQIYNNQGSEDRAQAQAFVDTWEWGDEAIKGYEYITDVHNLNNGKFTPQTVELIKGLEKVLGRGALLAYLISMTLRIVEIHRVLKPTGSFYLHCDPTASHYLKIVCDGVFCGNGGDFRNEIIWDYSFRLMDLNKFFNRKHDIILFYSKSDNNKFNMPKTEWTREDLIASRKQKIHIDKDGNELIWMPGGKGNSKNKMRRVDDIIQGGKAISDVWPIPIISSSSKERLGYPTQKPELLLERIIKASSNEGDTILDAYCGCGTTVSVAQRLKRRWIGIDITFQSISLILKRLKDTFPDTWATISADMHLDGVPRDMPSAIALANRKDDRTRKEFEKWAVLTYSDNQARINDKKGADGGIDGFSFFLGEGGNNEKAVFQVKSGNVGRKDIAAFNSDRQRENAQIGIFITLQEPTSPMKSEAMNAGKYQYPQFNKEEDRIQIVTIQEILNGERLALLSRRDDAVKSAKAANLQQQVSFFGK